MKKRNDKAASEADDLRDQYDFNYGKAKPNRFAQQLGKDAVMVALEPDVAAAFPTSEAVNRVLRLVMELSLISAERDEV